MRLLRETLVTSGTMTSRIDRLTGRGLVERLPDPATCQFATPSAASERASIVSF